MDIHSIDSDVVCQQMHICNCLKVRTPAEACTVNELYVPNPWNGLHAEQCWLFAVNLAMSVQTLKQDWQAPIDKLGHAKQTDLDHWYRDKLLHPAELLPTAPVIACTCCMLT